MVRGVLLHAIERQRPHMLTAIIFVTPAVAMLSGTTHIQLLCV